MREIYFPKITRNKPKSRALIVSSSSLEASIIDCNNASKAKVWTFAVVVALQSWKERLKKGRRTERGF